MNKEFIFITDKEPPIGKNVLLYLFTGEILIGYKTDDVEMYYCRGDYRSSEKDNPIPKFLIIAWSEIPEPKITCKEFTDFEINYYKARYTDEVYTGIAKITTDEERLK